MQVTELQPESTRTGLLGCTHGLAFPLSGVFCQPGEKGIFSCAPALLSYFLKPQGMNRGDFLGKRHQTSPSSDTTREGKKAGRKLGWKFSGTGRQLVREIPLSVW